MSNSVTAEHVTETVALDAPFDAAFAFLADPLEATRWAVKFFASIEETPQGLFATTPMGRVPLRYTSDPATGVIDMHIGDGPPLGTRLVRSGAGCVYVFHLNRAAGMPDAAWQEGVENLRHEFAVLKKIVEEESGERAAA